MEELMGINLPNLGIAFLMLVVGLRGVALAFIALFSDRFTPFYGAIGGCGLVAMLIALFVALEAPGIRYFALVICAAGMGLGAYGLAMAMREDRSAILNYAVVVAASAATIAYFSRPQKPAAPGQKKS